MKQRLLLLTVGSLVLTLSACGGGTGAGTASGSGAGERTTKIKLVAAEYSKDNTKAFWDSFATTYKNKYGYELEVQVVPWEDIDQQSSTMIQNQQMPDILNLNAYAGYAKDGLLYHGEEVLPPAARSDLIDTFVTSGTYQGKLYGFPDLSSTRALFYNKTLFAQAGIIDPPKSWDDFVAAAKKITALGNGQVGYAMPLGPEESQAEMSIWMFNNGGDWKSGGTWTINSDKNVETLTFLKNLAVVEKVTQNNPGKTNRADAFDLFKSGRAGMVVGFSPLAAALDKDAQVQYGIAPMPTNGAGPARTFGVTDYLMAFKKNGNQDAVKKFYELYYAKEQVNTFIKKEGFLPVTKSGIEEFKGDPKLTVYLDTLPQARLTPTDDPTWDKVKLAVQQNLGRASAENGDPKAVLDRLQGQAEAAK
ncbi:carbohydrate ABC transporter substrate-binding protein, CUT1 family [Austwickia chelonae]|uniref:Putative ABC transporter substrate-binding protein n=1 Tax=Austwickia chelonae NBRC 105200 TaxID=1184607 RepID=K6ULN7_9MICO|nr:extracellular solute-binding protein [Austwickia chelonae]GAB77406.1 putative ABC transporter substrate-binding protein [Austwickia chelonae NBRC 105200]SEW09745.1 carbohydrate ABC transporter substrate-binding protein, CUT1 family [Austwickia chelonae]